MVLKHDVLDEIVGVTDMCDCVGVIAVVLVGELGELLLDAEPVVVTLETLELLDSEASALVV